LEAYLELRDNCCKIDRTDKGAPVYREKKRYALKLPQVIHNFKDNILPFGESAYPFTFMVPPDLPQSMQTRETDGNYKGKLKYFFKVQVVPVNIDLLNDQNGKSQIRARERILVSPVRPVVTDPQCNVPVVLDKKVGFMERKSKCEITVNKNFYVAGETAYIWVNIDNTNATHACSLIVSHKHKLKVMMKSRKASEFFTNKKEKFFLCNAKE
jgi:hypothetical protein